MRTADLRHDERGFSLVEILVVVSLSAVLMAMAVVQIGSSRAVINADNGMRLVMGELARSRDAAVQQRRLMRVAFVNTNQVTTERKDVATPVYTLLRRATMEGNIKFALPAGTPDTTDAFGNSGALDFDGANPTTDVCFNGDGMLVRCTTGTIINGTIFLAAPNDQFATRAVTILGSTGRVRGFRRQNTLWGRV